LEISIFICGIIILPDLTKISMKIAIISDTHDNLATLDKFLDHIKKNPVGAIIHCGDIAEGETLARLAENFSGPILAVFGNMDYRQSLETAAEKFPGQIQLFNDCRLANPGTLAGMFYQATFAILDAGTKKLELKIVSRLDSAKTKAAR